MRRDSQVHWLYNQMPHRDPLHPNSDMSFWREHRVECLATWFSKSMFPLMKHPTLLWRESIPDSANERKDSSMRRRVAYGIARASLILVPNVKWSKFVIPFKNAPRSGKSYLTIVHN